MLRIEELRKKMGLSQEDLAKKLNMTQQRISSYEKGKREPDLETLKLFADFFHVSTDYLIGKTEFPNHEKINIDEADIAFYNCLKGLNETNKQILKNIYEGLIAKQNQEKDNNK